MRKSFAGALLSLCAAGVALSSTSDAVAARQVPRAADEWTIIEGEFGCTLHARAINGRQIVGVDFTVQPDSEDFAGMRVLIGPGASSDYWSVGLKVGSEKPRAAMVVRTKSPDGMLLRVGFANDEAKITGEGSLIVLAVRDETLLISTGRAALLLHSLAACDRKALLGATGVAVGVPSYTPPKGSAVSFFKADDYPSDALRAEAQGGVGTLLIIDSEGRVERCVIADSSGNAALDAATCRVFKARGRFVPARAASGEPTRGIYRAKIMWTMFR